MPEQESFSSDVVKNGMKVQEYYTTTEGGYRD
jgi:hypothetical protein